jgi:hypothetical protein
VDQSSGGRRRSRFGRLALVGMGGGLETKEGEKGGWPVLLGLTKLAVNSGSRQQWQEVLLLLLQQEQQINARFCKVPGTVPLGSFCVCTGPGAGPGTVPGLVCVVCVYEGVLCFGLVDLAAAWSTSPTSCSNWQSRAGR